MSLPRNRIVHLGAVYKLAELESLGDLQQWVDKNKATDLHVDFSSSGDWQISVSIGGKAHKATGKTLPGVVLHLVNSIN